MNWKVPFFDLSLGDEERRAVCEVIESNWLTAGPRIAEFESAYADALQREAEVVAVSSATAALHLSLSALGVGPGDEVILPSLTFVACANAVRYVGARPVFADVTSDSDWNISPEDVAQKITPRTKAIMVVHYAGYPCDMDRFVHLAEEKELLLIEDCSHAPMGTWKGRVVGTFGDAGCLSFFSNKNMTTGEGGMVVSRDLELLKRIRVLRSHGITTSTYERFKGHAFDYDVREIGYNYRLDEIRAAIGIQQLKKLPVFIEKRKERVARYRELIGAHLPRVRVPFSDRDEGSSHHIFPVLLPGDSADRDSTLRRMADLGIQCSIHYRPIHTLAAYENNAANLPVTDRIFPSILTLPLFPTMLDSQIELVIKGLQECL